MVDGTAADEKAGADRGSQQIRSSRHQSVGHAHHKAINPASSLGAPLYVQPLPTFPDRRLRTSIGISRQLYHEKMLALVAGT
jgi:hypothetical protein